MRRVTVSLKTALTVLSNKHLNRQPIIAHTMSASPGSSSSIPSHRPRPLSSSSLREMARKACEQRAPVFSSKRMCCLVSRISGGRERGANERASSSLMLSNGRVISSDKHGFHTAQFDLSIRRACVCLEVDKSASSPGARMFRAPSVEPVSQVGALSQPPHGAARGQVEGSNVGGLLRHQAERGPIVVGCGKSAVSMLCVGNRTAPV